MKLRVVPGNARQGNFLYTISPERRQENGHPYPEDEERLAVLQPRIEAMAHRQLGERFVSLTSYSSLVELQVKIGTSTVARYEFQDLCGWINLFDTEDETAAA